MAQQDVIHIVDDDESVRKSLSFLLSSSGYAVRVHESATTFLEVARSHEGCLITDLRMPDIGGVDLLKRMRDQHLSIPVIVVTGHGDVQAAVECMKSGAVDFLEKPFSDDALLDALGRAVNLSRQKSLLEREHAQAKEKLKLLSERERQVLEGVVSGLPSKTIAYNLGLSPRTVEIYRATVMNKMQAKSLAHLVRMSVNSAALNWGQEAD